MKESDIDGILQSAPVPEGPRSETLQSIAAAIRGSLRPVRPLPAPWLLTAGLVFVSATIALAAAAHAGFDGIEKMAPWERALIFIPLGAFAVVAAKTFVRTMIPGSRRRLSAGALLALCTLSLLGAFALSFRDYQIDHFVSAGFACLVTGLLHAFPAGLLAWFLLRRGFAVNAIAAGLSAGTLAGLVGLGVLELHCVNFQAAHVLVWHTAVVPLSGALGATCAAVGQWIRRLATR